jgi:thymidylate synthase ThyX
MKVENLDLRNLSPKQKIELCGRICYNSEDKITPDSANRFVQSLLDRTHYSVLEHEGLVLVISIGNKKPNSLVDLTKEILDILNLSYGNVYWQVSEIWEPATLIISANIRSWQEIINRAGGYGYIANAAFHGLCQKCGTIFSDVSRPMEYTLEQITKDTQFYLTSEFNTYDTDSPNLNSKHRSLTLRIDGISRACANQLVRHRACSFAQRSQRYCDETGFDYVIPPSMNQNLYAFDKIMRDTEEAYREYRELGIFKEDARYLLPNACTTNIVVTATIEQWKWMRQLRTAKDAQWEIRIVFEEVGKILDSI